MKHLRIGDTFPNMTVKTTWGSLSLPDTYTGKWLCLFSHPADFTPVCTTEFAAMQQAIDAFQEQDCELLGLSMDQVYSHLQWINWIRDKLQIEITFPIIADADGSIAVQLGFRNEEPGSSTIRGTYLIDPQGVIRAQLFYPNEVGRKIDELLRLIRALRLADRDHVVIPADWPENKLLGNQLLMPPPCCAEDLAAAHANPQSLDWWFSPKPADSGDHG